MLQLREIDLVLVCSLQGFGDALGSDCFDVYVHARDETKVVIHKTGVAAGWEIDEFGFLERSGPHAELCQLLLSDLDPAEKYRAISVVAYERVLIDGDH